MAYSKTRKTRKRLAKKKKGSLKTITRFLSFLLLVLLLAVSLCAVGYVIFFRTVMAQDTIPASASGIVFEEPDPPIHKEHGEKEQHSQKPDLPKVAIVIDDMGYHERVGEKLLKLPVDLSYSFLPFAPHTKNQEAAAHAMGKTILLHLPLEPKGAQWDPGPGALSLADAPDIQREKFENALQHVPNATGVNNHMGSLFTEDTAAMTLLLEEIDAHSLYYVDSYTTAASVGLKLARDMNIKTERRHIFLDNDLTVAKVCGQIEKLVAVAEKNGWAIGIGHPHEATLQAIADCTTSYSSRVDFVGVQEVLH